MGWSVGLSVGVGGASVEVVGVRRWGGRWSVGGASVEVGGASGSVGERRGASGSVGGASGSVGGALVDRRWKVGVVGPDNSTNQPTDERGRFCLYHPHIYNTYNFIN